MGIESLINGETEEKIEKEEVEEVADSHPIYQHTEITRIIRKAILTYMKGAKYQHSKVKEWQDQLSEYCLQKFALLKPPFNVDIVKYIVTCTILQKGSTGFQTSSNCLWDSEKDRLITYTHDDEEFRVIVNVFAIAV